MQITTQTPKGVPVIITVEGTSSIDVRAVATVKGQDYLLSRNMGGLTYPLRAPREGATHYLSAGKTGIALTAEEAARISAEYEAWLSTLPAEIAIRLRRKREDLALTIRGILDEQQYQRDHWFESENKRGPLPQYDTPRYAAAVQALADFDAAHPEIIAEIKREKAESAERHAWD